MHGCLGSKKFTTGVQGNLASMLDVSKQRIVVPTPNTVATTANQTVTVETTIEFLPPTEAGTATAPEVLDTLFKKLNDAASNRVAIGSEFKWVATVKLEGEANAGWRMCDLRAPCANGEFVESEDLCETNVRATVTQGCIALGCLCGIVVATLFVRKWCKGDRPEIATAFTAIISMADAATDAIVVAGYYDIKAKVPYAWIVGAFLMCLVAFTNLGLFASFYARVLCQRRTGGASAAGRGSQAGAHRSGQDAAPHCCGVQCQQPHDPAFHDHFRKHRLTFAIVAVCTFLFGFGWSSILYSRAAECFMPRFERPNHHIGTYPTTNARRSLLTDLAQLGSCEFGLRLRPWQPLWKICHS